MIVACSLSCRLLNSLLSWFLVCSKRLNKVFWQCLHRLGYQLIILVLKTVFLEDFLTPFLHLPQQSVHSVHLFIGLLLVYGVKSSIIYAFEVVESASLDDHHLVDLLAFEIYSVHSLFTHVYKRPLIEAHRHASLFDSGEVLLCFFLQNFVQVFLLCVWKILNVRLFAKRDPWSWVGDEGLPVNVGQEGMFLEISDTPIGPQSLLWVSNEQLLKEVFGYRVHLELVFPDFWPLNFFAHNVSENSFWRIIIKRQVSSHELVAYNAE